MAGVGMAVAAALREVLSVPIGAGEASAAPIRPFLFGE
jgi:hypothetical protein